MNSPLGPYGKLSIKFVMTSYVLWKVFKKNQVIIIFAGLLLSIILVEFTMRVVFTQMEG